MYKFFSLFILLLLFPAHFLFFCIFSSLISFITFSFIFDGENGDLNEHAYAIRVNTQESFYMPYLFTHNMFALCLQAIFKGWKGVSACNMCTFGMWNREETEFASFCISSGNNIENDDLHKQREREFHRIVGVIATLVQFNCVLLSCIRLLLRRCVHTLPYRCWIEYINYEFTNKNV